MGIRILNLAAHSKDFKIVQAFDIDTHSSLGKDVGILLGFEKGIGVKVESLLEKKGMFNQFKKLSCDVFIDFSGPDGTNWCVDAAMTSKKALVIGSTGLDNPVIGKIKTAATISTATMIIKRIRWAIPRCLFTLNFCEVNINSLFNLEVSLSSLLQLMFNDVH